MRLSPNPVRAELDEAPSFSWAAGKEVRRFDSDPVKRPPDVLAEAGSFGGLITSPNGLVLGPVLLLTGCSGIQSAGNPAGEHAALIGRLFLMFMGITGFFFLLVMAFLLWATLRRRREADVERPLTVTVAAWAGLIVLGLATLTLGSYFTDRGLAYAGTGQQPVSIKVTGKQWWWDVEYEDPVANNVFRTANEIHLPVGRLAEIELDSEDVIHSMWIPNLAGKLDLIPGRSNHLRLLPQRVGHFRAQCAEFCGLQHARMALDVIVEPAAQFAKWKATSLQPGAAAHTALQQTGYNIFMNRQCAACHTISGTAALGSIGPDLTHVASRPTIAAGTLRNTLGNMQGWISDPQGLKPGSRMPATQLSATELNALAAYLESLS